jgi:DNA-binding response OmpR family regulator
MKKILIIEDDRRIGLALGIRLRSFGYLTWLAADGAMALKGIADHKPDLILLDISLPDMDGFAVAEQIRSTLRLATPIIFLTASKRPEFHQRARDLGAVDFFEKPFESQDLLSALVKNLPQPERSLRPVVPSRIQYP